MKINIYGSPYHSLEYVFWTEETLIELFKKYDIKKAINYIEGLFAIQIIYDDKEIWITDYFGGYPIFFDILQNKVILNFYEYNGGTLFEKNVDYIQITKNDLDYDMSSNLPIAPTKQKHSYIKITKLSNYMHNTIFINNKYFCTPFKYYVVLPPKTILYLKKKTFKHYFYDIDKNFYPDTMNNLIQNCILCFSKKYKSYLMLSSGGDSRNICSYLYKLQDQIQTYKLLSYYPESDLLDNMFDEIDQKKHFININEKLTEDMIEFLLQKYIIQLNGMGNLRFSRIYFLYMIEKFLLNSMNSVIFCGYFPVFFSIQRWFKKNFSFFYVTGDGHLLKLLHHNINYVPPYAQKRFISNVFFNSKEELQKELYKSIQINKPELNTLPYMATNMDPNKKKVEVRNYDVSKLNFLNDYYKYMNIK